MKYGIIHSNWKNYKEGLLLLQVIFYERKGFTALLKTIFIFIFTLYDISTTSNLPNESVAECTNFNLVYCLLEA